MTTMISRTHQATSSVIAKARPAAQNASRIAATELSQHRSIHTKPSNQAYAADLPRTTATSRSHIPLSSWDWSRPPKPSQDSNDDVVPAYYIERRRQLDEIAERKEAEGGLMAQLSAGILSEGIAAQTRVRREKVPAEIRESDGTVRLASGFEPPTPAAEFHPVVAGQVQGLPKRKVSWDEVLQPEQEAAQRAKLNAKPQRKQRHGFVEGAVSKQAVRGKDASA